MVTQRQSYVYFLTNFLRTVLYIGVTTDLSRRIGQHRSSTVEGFSKKYHLSCLVYYEEIPTLLEAIKREKQLKGWKRSKKEALISKVNPEWKDMGQYL